MNHTLQTASVHAEGDVKTQATSSHGQAVLRRTMHMFSLRMFSLRMFSLCMISLRDQAPF